MPRTDAVARPSLADRFAWIWISLAPWVVVAGLLTGAIDRPGAQEDGADAEEVECASCGPTSPDAAGTGALLGRTPEGWTPLDLLSTDVRIRVAGVLVRGVVTQSFVNDTDAVLEAVYVFPLPETAAVHAMEMRIGERRIVSVVREREEARQVYDAARKEGRKAALVEQGRPNLFRTSVANLAPGEVAEVVLEYVHEADRDGDTYALAFPLTYVPRHGAAPFAPPPGAPRPAAIRPAVHPGLRFGGPTVAAPEASIEVRIDAGLPVEAIDSPTHTVATRWEGSDRVVLPGGGRVAADRDVVVRWTVAPSSAPRATVHVEDRDDGRYAVVQVLPDDDVLGPAEGLPTETLFVVDVSGSMGGPSIEQARVALLAALDRLRPGDRFDVLAFESEATPLHGRFVPADAGVVDGARGAVRRLEAGGGTDVLGALRHALRYPWSHVDGPAVRRIVFLTDGAIGNEDRVLGEIVARLGGIRLHVLGIGAAPNRHLVREMARRGRGLLGFVPAVGSAEDTVDAFFRRVDRPVLSSPALAWEGTAPLSSYPEDLPDLHAGEALTVSVRLPAGPMPDALILTGTSATGPVRLEVPVPAPLVEPAGVAQRWARARVDDLLGRGYLGAPLEQIRPAVVEIALAHGLVTRFTSRVAVEEVASVIGDATRVDVPGSLAVALPQGGTLRPLLRRAGVAALAFAFLGAWWLRRVGP